ncbi:MAG: PGPGW domain-containing protein [Gammaproteobacteria bacterium]|nr:PGPGW domain-containing protein [Gammaproteobacteria bacterium]
MLDFINSLLAEYEELLVTVSIVSAVIFVISLALMPWLLGKIPVDYFVQNNQRRTEIKDFGSLLIVIVKTSIGLVLLLAGIIMLVTPGQGVISILLGLFLMEFPGKRKLEIKFINHESTFKTLNWLRSKVNHPPFNR